MFRKEAPDPRDFILVFAQMRLNECIVLMRDFADAFHQIHGTRSGKPGREHVTKTSVFDSIPFFKEPDAGGYRRTCFFLERCRRVPIHHDLAEERAESFNSNNQECDVCSFYMD